MFLKLFGDFIDELISWLIIVRIRVRDSYWLLPVHVDFNLSLVYYFAGREKTHSKCACEIAVTIKEQ